MQRSEEIEISVVVPAFNEAEALPATLQRLLKVLTSLGAAFELIVVDDGSTDTTADVVYDAAERDERILPVTLSRNFGKESALHAGLCSASGACVVFLDADLQHPPELIPDMFTCWQGGWDVVNAIKRTRGREGLGYRKSAEAFNWLMSRIAHTDMTGASDFKLIDRQVADAILQCHETHRFFRGLVAWAGFRVKNLSFTVPDRQLGASKWSLIALLRYSLNAIVSFTSWPLVLIAYAGFIGAAVGLILLAQTLYNYFVGGAAIGFTTVIAVQILVGGLILVALGVISLYLSRLYDEQKARPIFLIRGQRRTPQTDESKRRQ